MKFKIFLKKGIDNNTCQRYNNNDKNAYQTDKEDCQNDRNACQVILN